MLPGSIVHFPVLALLAFANVTVPSADSEEEPPPRPPSALRPAGRWSTAAWEPCSNPCGAGEEQRRVSCVLEDAESTLIVATDGFCAPPRPTGARPCYQYRSECANTWVTGDWGQCSAKCGGGQRSRLVECHAGAGRAAGADAAPAVPRPLADAQCVAQLRPDGRRDCNLQLCPDGRRVWLRISDDAKPRRIRLFSKFTLRCPFHVYWTPADDRSKRKYAWYKDGRRLPLHEDKYTQTDGRGELRVKGADEPDSGVYTCASTTANPQGRSHNLTVKLERIPGEPTPLPPKTDEDVDGDDSPETSLEREDAAVAVEETTGDADSAPSTEAPAVSEPTTAESDPLSKDPVVEEVTDNSLPTEQTAAPAVDASQGDKATESPATPSLEAEELPAEQRLARRRRDEGVGGAEVLDQEEEVEEDEEEDEDEDTSSSSPNGAIDVVAARYDASPFSSCSAMCGPAGQRQRGVRCVDNESGAQLPLAACEDLGPPPAPQEPCNRVDCPAVWEWPSWAGSKCSRACGGGARWRQARCSQRLADGRDVTLEAARCAHLGPGEQRRTCHRAACRSQLRAGEVLRLDCLAANATWRHNGSALDLGQDDKYLADDDTGMLLVYRVAPGDAGRYLCDEEEDGGRRSTHRFDVTVLPPLPSLGDGDLFVRVWGTTTESGEPPGAAVAPTPTVEADTEFDEGNEDGEEDGDEVEEDAEEPPATAPPFPWHRLFGPAAALKGRVLGIFS